MILWTFQPYSVYEQVMQNGEYICDPNMSPMLNIDDDNRFRDAYSWMSDQIQNRVGQPQPPTNLTFPIWGWYRWNYKPQPPRFDSEARDYITVCMKLKIPDNEVLLSDFDMWHIVLGRDFIGKATNNKEFDEEQSWFDSLPKAKAQKVMVESWQKVFDITPRKRNSWTMNGGYVQGCFWKLKKEYICKVWRLEKGRKAYRLDLMMHKQLSKFKNI